MDPGVVFCLCGFVVFTTGGFTLSLALLFVLVFFSPFSIVITSLGEERAGLYTFRAFVCLLCTRFLSLFSSSWYQRMAAACDCGNP